MPLRYVDEPVIEAVLALNQAHVTALSALDAAGLHRLITGAFHATVLDNGAAFMIAFDHSAAYDSPNFRWFQSRYPKFVYVDRIAVAAAARGRGLARKLYDDLFAHASASGHSLVTCEINIEPPNTASDAFHAALGFGEVGDAQFCADKRVRYMRKLL